MLFNNTADFGGALLVDRNIEVGSRCTLTDTLVTGNTALTGGGGAYMHSSVVFLCESGCVITANTALVYGPNLASGTFRFGARSMF